MKDKALKDNAMKDNAMIQEDISWREPYEGMDASLLDRIAKIIDSNLTNPELTTQYIAKELGIGLRNIYRKLEGITSLTPKDMIREARLERARQLLTKTGMNVEEVCYQAGFSNRGTFYKLFSLKFGCTPKQYHEDRIKEAKDKLQSDQEQ